MTKHIEKIIKVLEMKKYNYQNIKVNGYTGLTGYQIQSQREFGKLED